jgi:hypothetical protein
MIGLLLVSVFLGASDPSPLEVSAALSGFNLLSPESRCCAFELFLSPDGRMSFTLHAPHGNRTKTLQLSKVQLASLRQTIEDSEFFSLPKDLGDIPVDGDEHRMSIRIGSRANTVRLYECSSRGDAGERRVRRACAVWYAIRNLVNDPEATVR